MLMKCYFRIVSFCLLCIWGSSCSTAYYLEHHPGFANDVFHRKVISAEKELVSNDDKLYLEAAKLRTKYTYAFNMISSALPYGITFSWKSMLKCSFGPETRNACE